MDLTLPEIIEHIAALQAQFLIAKAANDRAQMAELEAAFQALRVLRARASAQEADTLAETLDNHGRRGASNRPPDRSECHPDDTQPNWSR